ncbi:BREX system P-loop protein BrxC [Nostoc sp. NMS4]|uniref:BREX system P-loop protein BrxC n=1 Tax=Nostoc sp. NMS4 TaxID=2815390 RepID=UPI0025F650A0|nr:BREX system P-loop protein BrxC [Nostoc sp. NMS4]MBN3923061.1 BREX system P-loop protein BrxC [Nostoc sp. NMS4]
MTIKDIFAADVARNIAPVVYFHEQDPAKVLEEVSEYIITGGYPENDPRHKRVQSGIHEQFVKLLKGIAEELQKRGGVELPASWISGFYGSGKSSFAKLLGLALDGIVLPNGHTLADTLLERDDSPKSQEFRDAWHELRNQLDPIAVVFDIGAVARDDEDIHSAVKREIQSRLGYCTISHYVADHELKLELDRKWDEFLSCAEQTLGEPWLTAKHDQLAEEAFSEVMHAMNPNRYIEPMSWLDSRAGAQTGIGTSVDETTTAIINMLKFRAPNKNLFVVVDEVSQYIYQNTNRMLKLQSFVSALGQKLKGRVWLLATGQQKLEDSDDESNIGKLKDRFPPKLRVHLAPTNIRDVVHKRLLKKAPNKEPEIRALFQQHRSDLKLYGYKCDSMTEEDFLEVYPMLPGYVDLLMQITSNLRTRSSRAKGDDYAIRGLLQLLGELFREQKLGDKPIGALVTLENIYEVQQSALDADVQNTLARLFSDEQVINDEMAVKVAKVVALLELIQEQEPTTANLVSQCLYSELGMGNPEPAVTLALEKLRGLGLLSYSDKLGYKIQSSAGQEWQREREQYSVISDAISIIVAEKLKSLLGSVTRPQYKNKNFYWAAFYSDGRQRQDERLQSTNDVAVMTVDFRYLTNNEDRNPNTWIPLSSSPNLQNRLIWLVGTAGDLASLVKELAKSRHIIQKYEGRHQTISKDKQRLWFEEQGRCDSLEKDVQNAIAQVFTEGQIFFRGRQIDKPQYGTTFNTILERVGESILPELYSHYIDVAVTPEELKQLLELNLSGPSHKFMKTGLGILELDAGKYSPTCSGEVPTRIAQHIQDQNGVGGNILLNYFGGPPYGYPADVVKACLVGLLRGGKVRIRPQAGPEITSVRDPGARDIFEKDREIKRADILPPNETSITPRDRIAICKFFKDSLDVDLDRENDAIADASFQQFPGLVKRLQDIEKRYNKLPSRPDLPVVLQKLREALEKCTTSRQVENTVIAVKKYLDALRDGIQQLGIVETDLTDTVVAAVTRAVEIQEHQVKQLRDIESLADISGAIAALETQLQSDRPWREINSLEPSLQAIEQHYKAVRLQLIERQERQTEEIRDRIKQRPSFNRLNEKQSEYVFRPLQQAAFDTTKDVLYPTLVQLRDSAVIQIQKAEDTANTNLDDLLSKVTEQQVIQLNLELSGREVSTPEEVEALLNHLRERLLTKLKNNTRIRLI